MWEFGRDKLKGAVFQAVMNGRGWEWLVGRSKRMDNGRDMKTRARGHRPESPEVTQDSWDPTIVERGFEPKCTFIITNKVTPAS